MNQRRLLIAGIDPGTTTGYAFLDGKGMIIHSGSSKEVELKALLKKAVSLGKVIAVGTDKAKTPRLVQEFAAKIGAKTVHPEEDLKAVEKKEMVRTKTRDAHESDAVASAMLAYKSVTPLIRKVRRFCFKEGKENLENQIAELVIRKGMSVSEAAYSLKEPVKKVIISPVKEKNVALPKTMQKLRTTVKQLETEISILRKRNSILQNKGKKEVTSIIRKINPSKRIEQKNSEIKLLRKKLSQKDRESKKRGRRISVLEGFLHKKKDHYLLKKLNTLGKEEFQKKKGLLNIQEGDILLVDDPGIVSWGVVGRLKGIHIVIHKKELGEKVRNQLPFLLISFKDLEIEEDLHLALTKKKEFDAAIRAKTSLKKIVEEYQQERFMKVDRS